MIAVRSCFILWAIGIGNVFQGREIHQTLVRRYKLSNKLIHTLSQGEKNAPIRQQLRQDGFAEHRNSRRNPKYGYEPGSLYFVKKYERNPCTDSRNNGEGDIGWIKNTEKTISGFSRYFCFIMQCPDSLTAVDLGNVISRTCRICVGEQGRRSAAPEHSQG